MRKKAFSGLAIVALATIPPAILATPEPPLTPEDEHARHLHEQEVMKSSFCGECHPAIYAEHQQSTHGRAFTDEEVRLATGRFEFGDCINCHTPRPIFETGIGMNPMRRHYALEDGNSCMTCHFKKGVDYGTFEGGAECKTAFDDRVGTVEACSACHRNHGTPYQWEKAPMGKASGRECLDCHMEQITRPVALGEEPRPVRSHVFPGCRSEDQVRKAYSYDAKIEGNEVSVKIKNRGAGHNFPTELKQRAVESLVVIRDVDGKEVSRSRMVMRDPYKRPYGLHLPVNTQIPSGQTVEHRVPIGAVSGTVETQLFFKFYYPIGDHHPDLSRRLEIRRLVFDGLTPSTKEVVSAPEVDLVVPESIRPEEASPANLIDFARPPIGTVKVDIPEGDSQEDIKGLIDLFMFPVPGANKAAQKRLVEIGNPAIPQLIEGMGSWDNKTWKQSMSVLQKMGEKSIVPLIEALDHENLYVRVHARVVLVRLAAKDGPGLEAKLTHSLFGDHALDRSSSAEALGKLGMTNAIDSLRKSLSDRDPDVVRSAAFALAYLQDKEAGPMILKARDRFTYLETKRDLDAAMAHLGLPQGIDGLLPGLDHADALIRESYFELFFGITGLHFGYDPNAPRPDRLESIALLQQYWAVERDSVNLRPLIDIDHAIESEVWSKLKQLANGDPKVDDVAIMERFIDLGEESVPFLIEGLKYPSGFDKKRAIICEALGVIGSRNAVPALVATLRDPVISVANVACWALEQIRDTDALAAVQRFDRRILTAKGYGTIPFSAGHPDALITQAARTRLRLGDDQAPRDLVAMLLSDDVEARSLSVDALKSRYGVNFGYDPEARPEDRREAAKRWAQEVR